MAVVVMGTKAVRNVCAVSDATTVVATGTTTVNG
jgi:hypothetical protein